MLPRFLRILAAVIIVSATTDATKVHAQDAGDRSATKVVSFAEADNVHELYVAVIGEVDTPGTYRLGSSSLKLHRVIQCARGFTKDASKAIRLVRMGRVRQTEIFSEDSDSPLLPGDLLIVESRKAAARSENSSSTIHRDAETVRANYNEGTIRSGIQIALLNVLDYPLVLRLRPDQANATYLVQALGQPVSLLSTMRVITPDIPRRQTSDAAKRAAQMEDGSVIVFEPGKVKRNRLPVTLPNPLDTDRLIGSRNGLMASRIRNSHELRNLGQHPFWSSPDPFDNRSEIRENQSASILPLEDLPNVIDETGDVNSSPVSYDAELAAKPAEQEGSAGQDESPESSDSLPMSEQWSAPTSDDPVPTPSIAEAEESTIASTLAVFLHILFLTLVVVACLLVAIWVFVSENRKTAPSRVDVEKPAASEMPSAKAEEQTVNRSLLRRLVEQQPAIREEEITFSEGFDVEGRMQTSSDDAAAELEFISNATIPFEPSNRDTAMTGAQDQSGALNETMSIPIRQHPDFSPRRPAQESSGLHDELEKDAQTAPTPLARALLQLEQRRTA